MDIYGAFLPPRQKQVMVLKLHEDFSFGEIAQTLCISRQASEDALKRGVKSLTRYEEVVGFVRKSQEVRKAATEALTLLNAMTEADWDEVREKVAQRIGLLAKEGQLSHGV